MIRLKRITSKGLSQTFLQFYSKIIDSISQNRKVFKKHNVVTNQYMMTHSRIFGRLDVFTCTCRDSHMFRDTKILKLGKNSLSRNNPDKVIYNFSSVTLSVSDKSLLNKGLNFALPPASLEYSEYLVDYQTLSEIHLV